MSTPAYAFLIAFLLSFGGLCWLAVMLGIERDAHAVTKADYEKANENRRQERGARRLYQAMLKVSEDDVRRLRAERDDAHRVMAFVLNHRDVATTLDMVNIVPLRPKARA